jgi:hypothetical protein
MYIQTLKDERITGFRKVQVAGEIQRYTGARQVSVGDEGLYFFIVSNADDEKEETIIWGTRHELEPQLLRLLFSQFLKGDVDQTWIGLTLTSFLRLHGKTASLINKIMEDLEKQSIIFHLDKEQFIPTANEPSDTIGQKAVTELVTRFKQLRTVIPELALDDLTFFEKTILHLGKIHFNIHDLLFSNTTHLGKAFGYLVRNSNELFRYLLTTKETIVQQKIESWMSWFFSSGAISGDNTALEIGYRVDNALSAKTEDVTLVQKPGSDPNQNQAIQDLIATAKKITDNKLSYA